MKRKSKRKFFLTKEEIVKESQKANELAKQGLLKEHQIPDYWCQGVSKYKKTTNLVLAIFLGFFAIDRFYLKKYISACIKLFFICIVTPVSLWVAIGTSLYASSSDNAAIVIIFSILFHGTSLGYYLGDIITGCIRPRDHDFKELYTDALAIRQDIKELKDIVINLFNESNTSVSTIKHEISNNHMKINPIKLETEVSKKD